MGYPQDSPSPRVSGNTVTEDLTSHLHMPTPERNRSIVSRRGLVKAVRTYWRSTRRDPVFARAALISLAPALLAACVEAMQNYNVDGGLLDRYGVLVSGEVYGVVTTLMGFLVVFRNSQAYGRFWEACSTIYQAQGFLADACSSLVAFCSVKEEKEAEVRAFRHTLIRLLSLMSSLMLAELEFSGQGDSSEVQIKMPVLDMNGLKGSSLENLSGLACKVEVVFQWIQQLCVAQLRSGVVDVPAPIATRAFQELGASVLQFQAAMKIAQVPFPSTYMATMMALFSVHTCLTPICMAALVDASGWAFILTFISCFTLWSLALLGLELDNPFKHASNRTIDLYGIQTEQNERLVSLVVAAEFSVPSVVKGAKGLRRLHEQVKEDRKFSRGAFRDRGCGSDEICRRFESEYSVDSETEVRGEDTMTTCGFFSPQWYPLPVQVSAGMRSSMSGYTDFIHTAYRQDGAVLSVPVGVGAQDLLIPPHSERSVSGGHARKGSKESSLSAKSIHSGRMRVGNGVGVDPGVKRNRRGGHLERTAESNWRDSIPDGMVTVLDGNEEPGASILSSKSISEELAPDLLVDNLPLHPEAQAEAKETRSRSPDNGRLKSLDSGRDRSPHYYRKPDREKIYTIREPRHYTTSVTV